MRLEACPVLPVTAALVSGIGLGTQLAWCPIRWVGLLAALGLSLGGSGGRLLGWLALGLTLGLSSTDSPWSPAGDRPVTMGIEVAGFWQQSEDGVWSYARGTWLRQGREIVIWSDRMRIVLPPGSVPPRSLCLRVKGFLRRSVPAANGGIARPGIRSIRLKSMRHVVDRPCSSRSPAQILLRLGRPIRARIARRLSDWQRRGASLEPMLVRVFLLGQASALPDPVARAMRAAGMAHLSALSGLHLGLLAGVAWLLTAGRDSRLRFGLTIGAALSYLVLAGGRPSLWRACGMLIAVLATWSMHRVPQPVNTLSWVATTMVVLRPGILGDLGFQLTVVATAGILVLGPLFEASMQRLPEWLRKPLAVSAAAQLATLPWTSSLFHLFNPLTPLWNLVGVPWAAAVVAFSFAWMLTILLVPPVSGAPEAVLSCLAVPLGWLETLPPEVLGTHVVSGGWIRSTILTVLLMGALGLRGARRWLLLVAAAGVATGLTTTRSADPEVVLLDVGQGEAILLVDRGSALLIDGGGWRRGDFAQRVLLPALASHGVHRLAGMVVTHPDVDHCAGLLALSSYLPVRRFYTSPGWGGDPCVAALLSRPRMQVRVLWRGEEFAMGRWRLQALHPSAGARSGRNDRSLVLRAETGDHRILLTGDLERRGEAEVLEHFAADLAGVDILKIGHHGSASSTSNAWIEQLRPRLALLSCGRYNRYGHPSPAVLDRLRRHGVPVLRTDRSGALRLVLAPGPILRLATPGSPPWSQAPP